MINNLDPQRYSYLLGSLASKADDSSDAVAAPKEDSFAVNPVNFNVSNQVQNGQMQQETSPAGNAGQLARTAGTFAINPYLGAAGLGLQAYGMIAQQKQQEREAEYTAKLQRISKIQDSLAGLANSGMGLSRI